MSQFLGRLELRNPHWVYSEGGSYRVVSEDPKGVRHEQKIAKEVVDFFYARTAGQQLTAQAAADVLEPLAQRLKLPFTYGDKLRYYAQDVLLILAALNKVKIRKVRRGFLYIVSMAEWEQTGPAGPANVTAGEPSP